MLKSSAPIIFSGDEADLESSTVRAEQAARAAFVWPNAGVSAEKNSCLGLMSCQPHALSLTFSGADLPCGLCWEPKHQNPTVLFKFSASELRSGTDTPPHLLFN